MATPIGNLKDITLRALEILKGVDLILAEDTRVTRKLLDHYEIKVPLESYHQHTPIPSASGGATGQGDLTKFNRILDTLKNGKNIALVTDAGTPGINDPGGLLIEKILEIAPETNIIPIPGPNAAITALSASGINADKFLFLGYPPHKKGRQTLFKKIAESEYPVVLYESTHRIMRTLQELAEFDEIKERKLIVARELTKQFETIYRGTINEILPQIEKESRGEFVIIINAK
ncbi:MAG: 16S rRNA (cytidine(1402)-2'-O)-methyltransferase [bacterium]|nr:16S rRNA (cytidine(1402)-2'-O)-methyltransferase [bacterium]